MKITRKLPGQTFIRKDSNTGVFLGIFSKFFKIHFLQNTSGMTSFILLAVSNYHCNSFLFFVFFLLLHYCHLSTFFALVTFNSADIVEKYSTKKMLFCKYAMLNITKICEKNCRFATLSQLQLFWIIFEYLFFRTPFDGCFCEFLLALNIQSKTSK